MAKAPKENYISMEKNEVLLVWNHPQLIRPKSIIILTIVVILFTLLLLWEAKQSLQSSLLIGLTLMVATLITAFVASNILNSDRFRVAIIINHSAVATLGWLWYFNISWKNIKKITCVSSVTITLPPAEFNVWISSKGLRPPIFTKIPVLTVEERLKFVEILKTHTDANSVELVIA